jgi:hypothetical protein
MNESTAARATPGAKMMYLIKRKPTTSREELVAHWFANHMPLVIERQQQAAVAGRPHATRYIATLFQANERGEHVWDGVAQLYWARVLPRPKAPFGDPPADSFQARAEAYWPWATTEYVILDGVLSNAPNTFNAPYPTTRSGFCKATFLVPAAAKVDYAALFDHWLSIHAPNVVKVMQKVGGFRYVVSHSIDPAHETYAGMAELYFPNADAWARFNRELSSDGLERFLDLAKLLVFRSDTEMVGIP